MWHSSNILHSAESLNHCCTDGALPLAVLQQCRGSGPLLLRECAFQAAFLLTVGNLPNCSRRHRDKKWPVPYAKSAWETANVHLGTTRATQRIIADLKSRSGKWLRAAVKDMARTTISDWNEWKKAHRSS